MSSTSIDELLGYEDGATGAGERGRAGAIGRTLLPAALIVAAIVGVLRLAGVVVSVILVSAGVLALFALRHLLRSVVTPASRGRSRGARRGFDPEEGSYHWPSPDAMRRSVARWEQRLAWHADAPATFGTHLQPALRQLASERLRQAYGVTIDGDPVRARAVLGEQAWVVLTGGHRRGPGQRELAQVVTALEELAEVQAGAPTLAAPRRSEGIE